MTIKSIGIVVLAVLAFFGGLAFFGVHLGGAQKLGSAGNAAETYYNSQWLVGGNQIGPTGTLNGNTQFGGCNLIGGSAGIAATSTKNFDCAVSGILPGDVIFGDPSPLAPPGTIYNFPIVKVQASSTAGFVTFTIANLSGAATSTLGVPITNGIEYLTFR